MSHLLEHARLGLPLGEPLSQQPADVPPLRMVSTAALRTLALQMLRELDRRADERLINVLSSHDSDACLRASSALAEMANDTDCVRGLERACEQAGDLKAAGAIHVERTATAATILGRAHTARMAATPRCGDY